jgi:hypothetical protein
VHFSEVSLHYFLTRVLRFKQTGNCLVNLLTAIAHSLEFFNVSNRVKLNIQKPKESWSDFHGLAKRKFIIKDIDNSWFFYQRL